VISIESAASAVSTPPLGNRDRQSRKPDFSNCGCARRVIAIVRWAKMDDTTRDRIHALTAQGHSQRRIAETLGLSRGAVYRAQRAPRKARLVEGAPLRPRQEYHASRESPVTLASINFAGLLLMGIMILATYLRGRTSRAEETPSPEGAPQSPLSSTVQVPDPGGFVMLPIGQVVRREHGM